MSELLESNDPELRMKYFSLGSEIVSKRQNFIKATILGFIVMLLSAAIWCSISIITDYQIGFMSLILGGAIALTVRSHGKGLSNRFSFLGGFLSLIGCILGNSFIVLYLVQSEYETSLLETFMLVIPNYFAFMSGYFTSLDLFFYIFAFYIGFKYSKEKYAGGELEAIGEVHFEN